MMSNNFNELMSMALLIEYPMTNTVQQNAFLKGNGNYEES